MASAPLRDDDAMNGPDSTAHHVIWLSPSPPAEPSVAGVAEVVQTQAVIAPKDLEVWRSPPPAEYGVATEVEGIARLAAVREWPSFHLVGFSAGATVALEAALALGRRTQTVTLIEPASIGDDDWSNSEKAWRTRIDEIFALLPNEHQQAFLQQMVPDGALPPQQKPRAAAEIEGDYRLYQGAIRATGFVSGDLGKLMQPTLIVTGGLSHPRFADVANRLVEVIPNARAVEFPTCSHLHSPQRHETAALAEALLEVWSTSS